MQTVRELFLFAAPTYDANPMIAHLEKKFASIPSEKFSVMFEEFIKFMFLRSQYGKGFIPLKGEVDDIWHEFILQTVEYEKFCFALPGKQFIHHNSVHLDDFSRGQERKQVVQELLQWLPNYYRHFGVFTEQAAEHWMIVGFLRQELKLSLDEINALAAE